MTIPHSDAFVFFGATGDLALKKIFPALQAMVKRGHLKVPVIGVARSAKNVDNEMTGDRGRPGGLSATRASRLTAKPLEAAAHQTVRRESVGPPPG